MTRTAALRQNAARSRQATPPTAWSRLVAQIVDRAASAGVERGQLLDAAGLRAADLADPDGRVPLPAVYAALEAMESLSGDPLLHMRVTRQLDVTALDALAFLVMTSPTLGAGLRAMLRYQRLFSEGERYELEERPDGAVLSYIPWGPPRRGHALMAEMFAVDVVVNASAMTGAPLERPRVSFAHGAPADRAGHQQLLGGVAAEFGRPRTEIWLSSSDLARRIAPAGQEAIRTFFERHLEERVRALPPASTASRALDLLMRGAASDVATLARLLHLSPRTLQRRLAGEGTSLRALADEAGRARAIELLRGRCSIAEVAHLLGFAEPSAFHRAFRRWTGQTPETYRRSSGPRDARQSQSGATRPSEPV